MAKKGIYIYGIVPYPYSNDMLKLFESLGLYAITFQNASAIVSDQKTNHINYLDRESLGHLLVHHQTTIEDLMNNGFNILIPMKLGTIVNSDAEVIRILSNGYELIISTFNKIEYCTEIDLVATWADFPEILKEMSEHPDIVAMKNNILKNNDIISQSDQLKIGKLVQNLLKQKNTEAELIILDMLSPIILNSKTHEVMNDIMLTNSAFLIDRLKSEKFENIIDQLDEEFNGKLNFKLVGPLPCYSFYTIETKELNPITLEKARQRLGLKEEITEPEIKKAYLEQAKLFHPDKNILNGTNDHFTNIKESYHSLLEYSIAARQSSKGNLLSLAKDKVLKNLILVKIKE
ncbi:MAG: GvpL/GvpF family gas vesicle protein [bacterium]